MKSAGLLVITRNDAVASNDFEHGAADLGIAQQLGLAQIVLLGDAAELRAVLPKMLIEPALVGKADAGAPTASLDRHAGVGCGRAAHEVALSTLGDVRPVEKDRDCRQYRRQQAAPWHPSRASHHGRYSAPPLNQRAIMRRSASVMWVRFPGGMTRVIHTCWLIIAAGPEFVGGSRTTPLGGAAKPSCVGLAAWQDWQRS